MNSSRPELNEEKQTSEPQNVNISAPDKPLKPVYSLDTLLNVFSSNKDKDDLSKKKNKEEALRIVFKEQKYQEEFDMSQFQAFIRMNKNCHRLFQPSFLATKVYYAAPLDEIEHDLRKAFKNDPDILSRTFNLGTVSGTLSELAVIGLDQTIRNQEGTVVDHGMAEKLLMLHQELSPDTYEQAVENTKRAAPFEDKEAEAIRESANFESINAVFDVFETGDEESRKQAIFNFKDWLKNQKPEVMTNNRYHINLIHLIYCAFDVFLSRGNTLEGGYYGDLSNEYCHKVIGGILESELPPRTQQILLSSLYHLFHSNRTAPRYVDFHSENFKNPKPLWAFNDLSLNGFSTPAENVKPLCLGTNCYYDHIGQAQGGRPLARGAKKACQELETYYSNYNCPEELDLSPASTRGPTT